MQRTITKITPSEDGTYFTEEIVHYSGDNEEHWKKFSTYWLSEDWENNRGEFAKALADRVLTNDNHHPSTEQIIEAGKFLRSKIENL